MTVTAIKSQKIIPNPDAPPLTGKVVLIDGDRIVDIVDENDASASGVETIDIGDATLMPGLFDCHVHLAFDPGSGTTTTEVNSDEGATLERMRVNAKLLLDAGVTTARDLGAPAFLTEKLRAEINAGETPGPNLQIANSPITVLGGHAHALGGEVNSIEDAKAMVQKNAAHGADVIKVMTTGGFMTAGSQPWQSRFSSDELKAIVEESHRLGLLTTTHALGVDGIVDAVNAGFDAIEHCGWVTQGGTCFDSDIAEKIVANNIFVDPTMNTACRADTYFCPWDDYYSVVGNLKKMHEAGIQIIAGTDAGIGYVFFERFADGLKVMSEAGMSNKAILAASTATAAAACGIDTETGTIAPGMRADLVAFAGNPLDSIDDYFNPRLVFVGGRRYEPSPIRPFAAGKELFESVHRSLTEGSGRGK
jgi:imidazolonepropionase-like amidohydrolase